MILGMVHSHIFLTRSYEEFGMNHEYVSSRIVQKDNEIASTIENELGDYGITPKELGEYLGKSREEWSEAKKIGKTQHNEAAFYYILKGFCSTDIIDYLLRDNLFIGAGYGNFDWRELTRKPRGRPAKDQET